MLNEYISKIKDRSLTYEESCMLDEYLYNDLTKIYELDVEDIAYIINTSNRFKLRNLIMTLLFNSEISIRYDFNESDINTYIFEHELNKALDLKVNGIALGLGDYYFDIDKDKSGYYYNDAFKDGLSKISQNKGYYYSLDRYLSMINNPLDLLNKLLNEEIEENKYSLDYIYVMMKRLILTNKDGNYLSLLDDAIAKTTLCVDELRFDLRNDNECLYLDEEKALCEMLCVKLGYLIENNIINDIDETIIKLEKEIKESGFVEFLKIKDYYISKLYN